MKTLNKILKSFVFWVIILIIIAIILKCNYDHSKEMTDKYGDDAYRYGGQP